MRVGATIFVQNYRDWDRYEAEERGEKVPSWPVISDRSIFLEEINIARIADDTGFDSVWTVEHHFTPYTMVTNPLQFLTYIAGITKRVDLGTMVVVLPWHNPVRVAEDVNMLATLLGPERNIICGVGRGLGRREYRGLCVDQSEARERFDESLQILSELLATGHCSFEGKHFQLKDVRLRPQPEGDLSAQLYCAGGTAETVQIIAKHAVRPLVIPTTSLDNALQNMRGYMRLRCQAGYAPSDTKLALWTYCAETESEARRGAEQYMVEYADSALRHYELLSTHLKSLHGYESYGALSDALRRDADLFRRAFYKEHPWGTPDQVIAKAKFLAEAFGTSEIMFIFKYGGMPMDVAEKSMRLFAREVMPALKELAPAPMQPASA
ncbi:MAG TPA: LLM class flavin-dependent oxidoreductase [Candidatus Binatia bacterium]|nr:LLM class flavin-dependent oxidoreductase [Candidatus Binatia bacterium]